MDYRTVKNGFYATLDRAGLGHLRTAREPFTFHDLRHSFGTLAVQVYPVTDVQVYIGHEKIETTMRDVHSSRRWMRRRRVPRSSRRSSNPCPRCVPNQ